MLSRSDYIGLCNALADTAAGDGTFMDNLKRFLRTNNPRFDSDKFDAFILKLIESKKGAHNVAF